MLPSLVSWSQRPCLLDVSLFVLSVALYCSSLWHEFTFDDVSAVRDNHDIRPELVSFTKLFRHDFWGREMHEEISHKSYRPLTVLTFRINYALHNLEPMGYHCVNLILNALVVIIFRHVALHTLKGVEEVHKIASLAALLFAVHPVHTEAVSSVVGRAELLSSLFFLCSLFSYTSSPHSIGRLAISLLLAAVATLCKEQGITVLGLTIASSFLRLRGSLKKTAVCSQSNHKWELKRMTSCLLTLLLIMAMRLSIMQNSVPNFSRFDNPASVKSFPWKHLTYFYLSAYNVWLLLCPSNLLCDYTMATVPIVESALDARNLLSLTVFLLLTVLTVSKLRKVNEEARVILMAVAMLVLPFLPASNLFFNVGFVVAERVLYTPSMGMAILVAMGLVKLQRWLQDRAQLPATLTQMLVVIVVVSHVFKTMTRDLDWRDELRLFGSGLRVTQSNAKLFNNVGHVYERRQEHDTALRYFRAASSVQPDDIGSHINVGRALVQLQRLDDAEVAFRRAKRLLPVVGDDGLTFYTRLPHTHLNLFLHLAHLVARNSSRLHEADTLYRQAIAMRDDFVAAYVNRGEILIRMNRSMEARHLYQSTLKRFPTNSDLLYNLAIIELNDGHVEEALELLNKTLEVDPYHTSALLNSALVVQEYGLSHLRGLAQRRLMILVNREKTINERVYFNLGMLAMDTNDYTAAEMWFNKAIATKPDSRLALFNLALLLSELSRPSESVPVLHQLLSHHHDHVKGLILLGEIYVNHMGNLDEADKCYRRILEIQPDHVQAIHNRCVVMVERGSREDLEEARLCLKEALRVAPNEAYIKRHLEIVEQKLDE